MSKTSTDCLRPTAFRFELYGHPSSDKVYVFNGDYVDRWAATHLLTCKHTKQAAYAVAMGSRMFLRCSTHHAATYQQWFNLLLP